MLLSYQEHATQLLMEKISVVAKGKLHLAAGPGQGSILMVKGDAVKLGWEARGVRPDFFLLIGIDRIFFGIGSTFLKKSWLWCEFGL